MVNPCHACSAPCCTNYLVTVTSFDVARIAERTGRKPEEFAQLHPAKVLSYDWRTVLQCYDHGKFPDYYLLSLKSWPCVFLDDYNRCGIHEFAPFGCRRYPHGMDGKFKGGMYCSALSKAMFFLRGPDAKGLEGEIYGYREIVSEWNARKGNRKDCLEFLMERTAEKASLQF